MRESFLDRVRPEIVKTVSRLKQEMPSAQWEERALQKGVPPDFRASLTRPDSLNIIAEIKKASPSRGVLCENLDPVALAQQYETHGASAISVVTEEKFFLGSIRSLAQIAERCSLPILRKDFILDAVQVAEARLNGAAAVLLIVAFLTPDHLKHLIHACSRYSLAALVEVHDEEELYLATEAGAVMIGVNNRDLRSLTVDLGIADRVIRHKRSDQVFISESGLSSNIQLRALRAMGYDAFLIGEHFVTAADPGAELDRLRDLS
jgi:indole-3-glycerol phosphate synthase